MAGLKLLTSIAIFPLLFVITYFNTEALFTNDFFQWYTILYVVYFLLSGIFLLVSKHIKITDPKIRQEVVSSAQFIFHICILFLPAILLVHYFITTNVGSANMDLRVYGKTAFLYLVLALSISPIVTFIKNKKLADTIVAMRKILGILSFLFFMRHGLDYFTMERTFALKHTPAISYFQYIEDNLLIRPDALSGVVAGVIMFILGITSNTFSMKILSGNGWKTLQSLVYPVFLLACIHVAFASRFDLFYMILIVWLIYIRTVSYIAQKEKPKGGTTTKYLCVPCGYIYDEALGDPDGGLAPGTKFEDIPDARVCPVCGVTKASFEPYYDTQQTSVTEGFMSTIANYVMLTKDVVELTLKVTNPITVIPGQYVMLVLKDFDGEFSRVYSVVEQRGDTIKLGIKIQEGGRGGRVLKKLKIGDTIKIKNIFGNFILKNTSNKKVFIGTGTGLSPLYNMILNTTYSQNNILFFGVRTQEDLFYIDKLKAIPNLQLEIFLSQDTIPPYHCGRINTEGYNFPLDTEFYLCGNKPMVQEQIASLKARGYVNIYMEIF